MATKLAYGLLAVVLALAGAQARVPTGLSSPASNQDLCGTCKLAVHVLDDVMCDPYVDETVVNWVTTNICPQFSDQDSCAQLVTSFAPVVMEWLRANASPEVLCADAGVCGANSGGKVPRPPRPARGNDMLCPLCMFVLGKVKEGLADAPTQDVIRQHTEAACNVLPPGGIHDSCVQWVDENEAAIFSYINTMQPEEVCQAAGTCMDAALARATMRPLSPDAVAALARGAALLSTPPSNDNCEICKVIILEMHTVVANPSVQVQAMDLAKQACALVGSLEAQCVKDVDQYAPMVFGMVLAYLQPDQVCVQLKMCPTPSLAAGARMQQTGVVAGGAGARVMAQ